MPRFRSLECCFCIRKVKYKYIKCTKCQIDICVKCFCFGVQEGKHLKSHPYSILDASNNDILKKDSKWTYEEESKFLSGLDQFKTGNWIDISHLIGTRTSCECRQHFIDNYLNNPFSKALEKQIKSRNFLTTARPIYDHTNGSIDPELYHKYPTVLIKPDEEKLLGFNQLRNEFVVEYDDKAENTVTAIQPNVDAEDAVLKNNLRAAMVDIYQHNLVKRHNRKHMMREHNLIPHVIAEIYEKPSRDFAFFHRQMLRRNYPNSYLLKSSPFMKTPPKFRTSTSRVNSRENNSKNGVHNQDESLHIDNVEEHSSWNYNASHLSDDLKPFLRFLTSGKMRELHENLKNEYILKMEIHLLKKCIVHGIFSLKDYKNYEKSTIDALNSPLPISANRKRQLTSIDNKEPPKPNSKRRKSIKNSFCFVNKIRSANRMKAQKKRAENEDESTENSKSVNKTKVANVSPRKPRNSRRK